MVRLCDKVYGANGTYTVSSLSFPDGANITKITFTSSVEEFSHTAIHIKQMFHLA